MRSKILKDKNDPQVIQDNSIRAIMFLIEEKIDVTPERTTDRSIPWLGDLRLELQHYLEGSSHRFSTHT
ncbi:hypothetical protein [Anaplasma phagocytophilum]|uniref:hypothetical protein n=1 Tax=Anaplasma phagocytophilum TaxID=948 RepID=UPI00201B289B